MEKISKGSNREKIDEETERKKNHLVKKCLDLRHFIMHYSWIGIATLLFATSASAVSRPSPSSAELKCNDSAIPSRIMEDCLGSGTIEGSLKMRECICNGLGFDIDSCTITCSGSSPSMREAPSIYSASIATGDRNMEGDPKIDTTIVVTNNKRTVSNAAAADVIGKDGGNIPRLSGTQQRQRRRRRQKVSSAEKQQPTMTTMRKIVGGIALGVLVMVI